MAGKKPKSGRCLCGRTRYRFDPKAPHDPLLCHCESCRRATSSPVAALFKLPDSAWRWQGDRPGVYRSSDGVIRSFCRTCGSPMSYATSERPGETGFYIVTLDDPKSLRPRRQACSSERLKWLSLSDDLPQK